MAAAISGKIGNLVGCLLGETLVLKGLRGYKKGTMVLGCEEERKEMFKGASLWL